MVKEIKIYIEGDTKKKGKNSPISLRQGFSYFFSDLKEKAKENNIHLSLEVCGSTDLTFNIFKDRNEKTKDAFHCFLVDSDKPLKDNDTPKSFLQREKKWDLKEIEDNQCQLMVQIMESWFLADVDSLKEYYGKEFKEKSIPRSNNVEKISKDEVEKILDKATKDTQKGIYCENKAKHSAEILERLKTDLVRQKAKHCNLLFETIEKHLS